MGPAEQWFVPRKSRVELKDTWTTAGRHIRWRRGEGCEISRYCPHSRWTPPLPPRTITFPQYSFTHHQTLHRPTLLFQLTLMCDRATGKHSVLGLAGCAVLIGVLIEGDYEYSLGSNPFCCNTANHFHWALHWVQYSDSRGEFILCLFGCNFCRNSTTKPKQDR